MNSEMRPYLQPSLAIDCDSRAVADFAGENAGNSADPREQAVSLYYSDSIYHPFDLEGKRHMEYLSYRGEFADVPLGQIEETFRREYLNDSSWNQADFDREVEQETGGV
jgi:hypothetical protein